MSRTALVLLDFPGISFAFPFSYFIYALFLSKKMLDAGQYTGIIK